jgi:glycosyltransferase involved in cell wall biosynthesis
MGLAMLNAEQRTDIPLSVVVNNYNYADFLPQALDSALEQMAPCDELIVIDDGSSDGSQEILQDYGARANVTAVFQSNQRQLAAVLNGLELARGELCVLLDSDDYFLDGYLERLRGLVREHPEIDFFFSAARPGGQAARHVESVERLLAAMAFPDGPTGRSRWSTWAGGEFLGTPTSGLALKRSLVDRFVEARDDLQDHMPLGDRMSRLLRVPPTSHTGYRLSADGILVRGSSILGARKYHCAAPAFHYRIHGGNAFAGLNRVARLYLRMHRSRQIARVTARAFGIDRPPSVAEVIEEARQRSLPLRLRRRLRLALNYAGAVLRARDRWRHRLGGLIRLGPAFLFRVREKPSPEPQGRPQ